MKLTELFPDAPVDLEISRISCDSREVRPGDLFVARRGTSYDGNQFALEAERRGAVAILSEAFSPRVALPQVIRKSLSETISQTVNRFYGFPSKKLFVAGVTGTNGKTTTTHLLQFLLGGGLMSTIEICSGKKRKPSPLTTLDLVANQHHLAEMVNAGVKNAAMEVSSHGIDQGRVEGIDFQAAIFTNLSHEHLDYHFTMERYAEAKAKLFRNLQEKALACINGDDPWSDVMVKNCRARVRVFGMNKRGDFQAKNVKRHAKHTSFTLQGQSFILPLIGLHNVYNALGAISVAHFYGLSLQEIASRIISFPGVPGRLERVKNRMGVDFFVDFAHTPRALEKVLQELSKIKRGRLITIFGCGGDRDREKRPRMGAIVGQYSDVSIITNDNPRSEDPQKIAEQILHGFKKKKSVFVNLDRRAAIARAIGMARKNDILLLAGKGHETVQICQEGKVHFDDREVARELFSLEKLK